MSDHLHPKAGCKCPDCNLARVVIDTAVGTREMPFPLSDIVEVGGALKELQFTDEQVARLRAWVNEEPEPGRCWRCGGEHTGPDAAQCCLKCRGQMAMERSDDLLKRFSGWQREREKATGGGGRR